MSAPLSPDRILSTGLAFWGSRALIAATELGVFTELAKGPRRLEDLRRALSLHERSARDFFDALVAMRLLERAGDVYSNGAEAAEFLVKGRASYVGGILEMCATRTYPMWGSLTEALRTGLPQNEMKSGGGGLFESIYSTPAKLRVFLEGMTGISLPAARALAAKFPWKDRRTFLDVGPAQGGVPVEIAKAHPHLTGIGFDLAVVRPVFEEYVARHGLSERLSFVGGDMFKEAWPKADAIVLGHILHDWDLAQKRALLKSAYESLPAGGSVIVYESIIDDDRRENAFGLLMSLNMLVETSGGFDFTGADCRGWMRDAGFRETRVEHLVGPDSMVIGVK